MVVVNITLTTISGFICFVFAFFVFRRYSSHRGLHLLLWGIGLLFYGIGNFCEAYHSVWGWNSLVFRLWYLFGAILVAAWLGQGTVYLLIRKKWAHGIMVALFLGSVYGLVRVFAAQLDPAALVAASQGERVLSGTAIVSPGVRILTPVFNTYGTVALVGGALWSAWIFWRKRILLHRTIGNILIAVGAMMPAIGGTLSRFGFVGFLYIGELLGALLMFGGFIRATTPIKNLNDKTVTDT